MPLFAGAASGQSLHVASDFTVADGWRRATGGEPAAAPSERSPVTANVDVGLIFDDDFTSEWGAGFTFQLEGEAAALVTPQFRLVRGEAPLGLYVGAGLPVQVTPEWLYGVELTGGVIYTLIDGLFGLTGGVSADYFFLGPGRPDGQQVLVISLGAGARVLF